MNFINTKLFNIHICIIIFFYLILNDFFLFCFINILFITHNIQKDYNKILFINKNKSNILLYDNNHNVKDKFLSINFIMLSLFFL